jgi:hypothetical protein
MGAGSAGVVVMNGREAGWSGLSGLSGCLVERARSGSKRSALVSFQSGNFFPLPCSYIAGVA